MTERWRYFRLNLYSLEVTLPQRIDGPLPEIDERLVTIIVRTEDLVVYVNKHGVSWFFGYARLKR